MRVNYCVLRRSECWAGDCEDNSSAEVKLQGLEQSGVAGDEGACHSCALKKRLRVKSLVWKQEVIFPYGPSDQASGVAWTHTVPLLSKENRTQCKGTVNEGGISQRRTSENHRLRRIIFWFRRVTDGPFLFFWQELLGKDSFFTWSPPSRVHIIQIKLIAWALFWLWFIHKTVSPWQQCNNTIITTLCPHHRMLTMNTDYVAWWFRILFYF